MATYLCERCGAEFTDHNQYREHKTDHALGRIPDKSVEELAGLEPLPAIHPEAEAIVAQPLEEKPKKGQQKASPPGKKPPEWSKAAQNAKKAGIRLTYQYTGVCPDCGGEIETLELDDVASEKSKVVAVAYCFNCRRKLRQTIVAKL